MVVAPTISERPWSRSAAPGAQRIVIGSPGRGTDVASSLSFSIVTSISVAPAASAMRRIDEPWKMTSLTTAAKAAAVAGRVTTDGDPFRPQHRR